MRARKLLAVNMAALLLGFGVAACGGSDEPGGTGAEGASCPDGRIRFGVEPYEDPAKLKPAYEVLASALSKKLNCKVELQVVEDYAGEVLAMRNGRLEVAQFGPLGYVFASQKAGALPLASFGDASGKLTTYTAAIWVRKDSPIKTVADLKGHSLALGGTGSTSGDALPRYALTQAGITQSDVKVSYAGGHPEAMLALKNGKVDAAQINSQTQATAEKEGTFKPADYRKLWTSDPIPNDPITVSDKLDKALQDKIKDALLHLQPADVAKVGSFLDVDPPGPLVAVTKDTYKPLFDLATGLGLTEKDV
jgi:phosphonate transport system substrate-binding protein